MSKVDLWLEEALDRLHVCVEHRQDFKLSMIESIESGFVIAVRKGSKVLRVAVSGRDHEEWLRTWETTSGKCHRCQGSGQEFYRWERVNGTMFAPCRRCNATGAAPA